MSDERYIWISRWEVFQHYQPERDRAPAWIKTYGKQLDDDRYLDLNLTQRGLLADLRLEFSRARAELRLDRRRLSIRLGATVYLKDLESLNHAGLIDFVSREALDQRLEQLYSGSRVARARSEQEEEQEQESKGSIRTAETPRAAGDTNGLPFNKEILVARLLAWSKKGADHSERSAAVIRNRAQQLSEGALAKIVESCEAKPRIRKRGAYIVGALKSEHDSLTYHRASSERGFIEELAARDIHACIQQYAHLLSEPQLELLLLTHAPDEDTRTGLREQAADLRRAAT